MPLSLSSVEEASLPENGAEKKSVTEEHLLVISLTQTSDEESDVTGLRKVAGILRDYPGMDEVNLTVINGEKIYNLKLSEVHVGYCPELHRRLVEVVGEDGLKVMLRNNTQEK